MRISPWDTSSALIDLGLVVTAPVLLPVVGAVVRRAVRRALKGGLVAYDTAAALVTTAGEECNHLVAEARSERTPVSDAPPEDIAPHMLRPDEASA